MATWIFIMIYGATELRETDWTTLPDIVWITAAYLAVFTTAGTFFLLHYATMRILAAKAIAYGYLTPSYIICARRVIRGRLVSPLVTTGALITILGLVILIHSNDV